jgi:asparagine synthase (glutamine-hydrolysing)
MCGIAGIVAREPITDEDYRAVLRMQQALARRGPDGAGVHRSRHAVLAMRRLSIIDLATGWQPLYDETGRIALVANGEIYNYRELRIELEHQGYRFKTGSDCETIVHAYASAGERALSSLRGMFAFALWDEARQRLWLARDRMGEKPLYLYRTDSYLLFASELKALLASGLIPRRLDREALERYFFVGYVPEPGTPVAGVEKLPAGHDVTIDVAPWRVIQRRYWRLCEADESRADPTEVLAAQLDEIANLTIRADVPVGVALSGGLDSTLIACMASRHYAGRLHAFTVGYDVDSRGDETEDARRIADHLGIAFHPIRVSTHEIAEDFPLLVRATDDPIADIAGYGYFRLMKAARANGVPVMLTGQGGDELFWGYPWLRRAAHATRRLLAIARGNAPAPGLLAALRPEAPASFDAKGILRWASAAFGIHDRLRLRARLNTRLADPTLPLFYELAAHHDEAGYVRRAQSVFGAKLGRVCASPAASIATPARGLAPDLAVTELICSTYLLENGLAQCDRLSMWWSVECRVPLVDYRLAEDVIGLRRHCSDLDLPPKAWLRKAAARFVPEFALGRPKRGFTPPVRHWIGELFSHYGSTLRKGRLVEQGVITEKAGRDFAVFDPTRTPFSPWAYQALVLEIWMREVLDAAASATEGTAERENACGPNGDWNAAALT